jgi:hypothetical protein
MITASHWFCRRLTQRGSAQEQAVQVQERPQDQVRPQVRPQVRERQ